MVRFRVPVELVEECGRLLVWRRLNQDAEGVLHGERFKEEMVRRLGEALWAYLEGLDAVARSGPSGVFFDEMGVPAVTRKKREGGAVSVKRTKRLG